MDSEVVEKILCERLPLDDVLALIDSISDEETLFELTQRYNWDMDLKVVYRIAEHPKCTLAVALCLFYDGDGVSFMMENHSKKAIESSDIYKFENFIYKKIRNGHYKKGRVRYDLPITDYRKQRLFEEGIDPIFLKNV